jgi:hypothetical protein
MAYLGRAGRAASAENLLPLPTTPAGQYASSIGEFAPAVAAGPGRWLSKLITAIAGGAGSEAAGQFASELASGDSTGEPYARILGGVAGTVLPHLLRAGAPLPASARHTERVRGLEREGVTALTAGERTGSATLKHMEEHLGASGIAGGSARMELPMEQFTRAAMARVGMPLVRRVDEHVIDQAFTRIEKRFDELAGITRAELDEPYVDALIAAEHRYRSLVRDPAQRPVVRGIVDDALSESTSMTGAQYKSLRSDIERLRRSTNNPELEGFLVSVRDAMDDMMERSITRTNPELVGHWREVRNQYRNMLVIEQAFTAAESEFITPQALRQAVVRQNRRGYARGMGDFTGLARAGTQVMRRPLEHAATRETFPQMVHSGLAGRLLMSNPVQAFLGNQDLAGVANILPRAGIRRSALTAMPVEQPGQQNQ